MKCISKIEEWKNIRKQLLKQDKSIGFVPTMGALHLGHQSLLERAKNENDVVILSIFVNPTQFNDPKDLEKYPRTLDSDLELAKKAGADFVFLPDYREIYADDFNYVVSEKKFSKQLCGKHRPGHFDGVLTIVLKLLIITQATRAYFGEKDYQQYLLIEQMVKAFFLDTEILSCTTVREKTGLAMSSRNMLLSEDSKQKATLISELLSSTKNEEQIRRELNTSGFEVDYVETHFDRRFIAAHLPIDFENLQKGRVRLIDNGEIRG